MPMDAHGGDHERPRATHKATLRAHGEPTPMESHWGPNGSHGEVIRGPMGCHGTKIRCHLHPCGTLVYQQNPDQPNRTADVTITFYKSCKWSLRMLASLLSAVLPAKLRTFCISLLTSIASSNASCLFPSSP